MGLDVQVACGDFVGSTGTEFIAHAGFAGFVQVFVGTIILVFLLVVYANQILTFIGYGIEILYVAEAYRPLIFAVHYHAFVVDDDATLMLDKIIQHETEVWD